MFFPMFHVPCACSFLVAPPAVDGAELAIEPRPGDVAPCGDVSGDILDWCDAPER